MNSEEANNAEGEVDGIRRRYSHTWYSRDSTINKKARKTGDKKKPQVKQHGPDRHILSAPDRVRFRAIYDFKFAFNFAQNRYSRYSETAG